MTDIAVLWLRRDLRLADNPALFLAARHAQVMPIYILDDINAGQNAMGAASRWWLHHALASLQKTMGGALSMYRGAAEDVLCAILDRQTISAVYWNCCYEPWRVKRDAQIESRLQAWGITVEITNGSLLWEPRQINKKDGTPYKVFTPFYRKGCLSAEVPRIPIPAPQAVQYTCDSGASTVIDDLELLPKNHWDTQMNQHWCISESGAKQRFDDFIAEGLPQHKDGRNLPAKPFVSKLSPYLHFGQLSPNQLWYGVRDLGEDEHIDHFCSELGWREFSFNLLYHNPDLPTQNLQTKFDSLPWQDNAAGLRAWQCGQTGVPMVDAGMRQLWQTGYIHNRVRMIVGSFLVKNLRLHWRHGERWFWDTLVDADLANNSAGWQWIAGCGADAAPYFRIFNCVTQGQKFDPDGNYVRQYVPEIARLPNSHLFNPWQAPTEMLADASITLGVDYPLPIVDLKASRKAALAAFQSLKQ